MNSITDLLDLKDSEIIVDDIQNQNQTKTIVLSTVPIAHRIVDNYDCEICFVNHDFIDENGNTKTEKVASVYLGALTPFIEELSEKNTPEELVEYKNRFPASSDVPSTYLKMCAEFDEKLKYISNNMQDGPYSSDEWDKHMKKLKKINEA